MELEVASTNVLGLGAVAMISVIMHSLFRRSLDSIDFWRCPGFLIGSDPIRRAEPWLDHRAKVRV